MKLGRCAIDTGGRACRTSSLPGMTERLVAMEMHERSVIVTGGASGIGKATALLLAREGGRVFVGDIDEAGGRAVAAEAASEGLTVEFLPLDLTKDESIAGFAATVQQRAGRVDGLVNGAGWDRIQPFMENPPEMWDQLIAINLLGAIRLTRAVLPPMIEARAGKIVTISSDAGRVGSTGETVYAAAKGGLIAFTKSLAREMARYRINVNCVCPGPTDTPLFSAQPERMREALTRAIPFRRIAQPAEIAEAVMFFLGRRSDYITGQVLSVSGGLTMVD
jgi:2-hydroxycyclohexanecarboxyl-CoA dehydrogenase